MVVAILTNQWSLQIRRDQVASADLLSRQSQQIQKIIRDNQSEARRLSAAIDILNSDRDRLYARVSSVEQGLDSVTGSIKAQVAVPSPVPDQAPAHPDSTPSAAPPPPATPPVVEPVASTGSDQSLKMASGPAPADPAATRPTEPPAPAPAVGDTTASVQHDAELPAVPVQRTEFGIDLGGANSVDGLRALWRGRVQSNTSLAALRPLIAVRERPNGLGVQLRLVAGPLRDAAMAARLCASLNESERGCETAVFDGQRLAPGNNEPAAAVAAPVNPKGRKPGNVRSELRGEPPLARPEDGALVPKPRPARASMIGRQ